MSRKCILVWFAALTLTFLFLSPAVPTHAQEPTPENDANCVSCHTHRYLLYDEGKWYCLCDAPMHCVYCHSGRTDSLVKEVAHEGLVLYPTRDHAIRCQSCHTEDYINRVVKFSTVGGISSTPLPILTATPDKSSTWFGATTSPLQVRFSQLSNWRLAGLASLGIGLILIAIMAYRCWKADCLAKFQA